MTIIDADRTAIDSLVAPTPFPGSFAVSYLRVSTKEQAEKGGQAEGFSIPAQREANQWAAPFIRSGRSVSRRFRFDGCTAERTRPGVGSRAMSADADGCTRSSSREVSRRVRQFPSGGLYEGLL